jgi:hypothetical protein
MTQYYYSFQVFVFGGIIILIMSNIKFISYLFIFLSFLSFQLKVDAEEIVQKQLDELNNLPSVEISNLLLDKNVYMVGDNIYGSFSIKNDRDYLLSNLKYTLSLVSDYDKDEIPYIVYDIKSFGPEILNKSEIKDINFIYSLPDVFYGNKDYGIRLKVYTGAGSLLGWVDSFIKINKKAEGFDVNNLFLIKNSYIKVDEKEFKLQEGPTIRDDRRADLHIVINNLSKNKITLFPEIKIYDRTISGDLINTFNPDIFELLPNKDNDISINLNKFIYKPGVYEGILNLKDNNGNNLLPIILFRYIVYGNIVTIQGISIDKDQISKNKEVNLNVLYTGSPVDIVTGDVYKNNFLKTSIVLKDDNNKVFAKYDGDINYSNGISVDIPLRILSSVKSANVEIKVFNDKGEIITQYKDRLGDLPSNNTVYFYILFILILVVTFFASSFLIKRIS